LKVTIIGISLTAAAGAPQSLTLNPQPVIDLVRLQSDTAFLGTFTGVRAGQYTGATVSFANAVVTFFNDTPNPVSSCPAGSVCQVALTAAGAPQAALSFAVASTTPIGIGLDFNLGAAVTISGGSLSLSFTAPNTLTAFTLPRTGSNLSAGQLDLIEDFTGVATITGQTVTIMSPSRGALTATATTSTNFDAAPYPNPGNLCPTGTTSLAACVSNSQIVSADTILKSDGTLALQEIEPLLATRQDIIEGTVDSRPVSATQFTMVVTDKQVAASGSLISSVNVGDRVTIILSTNPPPSPFQVDTKGLPVAISFGNNIRFFAGQTAADAIHPGQTVALHVVAFAAASGTTLASATADSAILRWSRFIANVFGPLSPTSITVDTIPSYFLFTSASQFAVQVFTGTNLDGVSTAASVVVGKPVAIRALYIDNPTSTANPSFFAAKIRQH
jgi:hypothetical protein